MLTVDTPVAGPRLRDVRNGLTIPPTLSLRTFAEGAAAPGVVVRPAHHRAAGVRLAPPLRGHGRRAGRPDVRPGGDHGRPRAGCARCGRGRWWSRGSSTSTTRARWSTPAPTRSSCPTTAAASSTGRRPRWSRCPAWSTRSATGPRSTSTAASSPAATSSPPSPSAPAPALVGRAYLYGLMAGGERGVQRAADILPAEVTTTLALLGVTRVARPGRTMSGCAEA